MIKAIEIIRHDESEDSEEEDFFVEDAFNKLKLGTVLCMRCAAHTLQLAVHNFLNDSGTE